MDKNIFQISSEYAQLTDALIEGELTPEIEAALALNKEELEVKGLNYGFIIKNIDSDCEIIDAEIQRLTRLKQYRQNAINRLKSTLSGAMKFHGIEEIKTPLLKINFRKSESVEIDPALLDYKYVKRTVTEAPDKIKIKEAIKSGEVITGAWLKQNLSIQIK